MATGRRSAVAAPPMRNRSPTRTPVRTAFRTDSSEAPVAKATLEKCLVSVHPRDAKPCNVARELCVQRRPRDPLLIQSLKDSEQQWCLTASRLDGGGSWTLTLGPVRVEHGVATTSFVPLALPAGEHTLSLTVGNQHVGAPVRRCMPNDALALVSGLVCTRPHHAPRH